jgi:hypothetical protein
MLINTHQEGEIAFQLHSLALLGRSIDRGSNLYPSEPWQIVYIPSDFNAVALTEDGVPIGC